MSKLGSITMFTRALILKTAALSPVERTVRRSRLFRPLVSRFIAGDSLEEGIAASTALVQKGLAVSLDILGESTNSEAEALQAKSTYIRMLESIAQVAQQKAFVEGETGGFVKEPINISIKLTQCGLDLSEEFAEKNLRDVLDFAKSHGNFVRVDMEDSSYTARTVALMTRILGEYDNTGTVLQAYLFRNDQDVETMIDLQARTRLVKGAYLEPSSVAHPEKSKVDEAYVRQAKRLVEAGNYPGIATHDEAIINAIRQFVEEKKIDKNRFEFQMLYGIRRDLQERLRGEGFNVRIYVPYGDQWYPYFSRRIAERPANATFILKAMLKG